MSGIATGVRFPIIPSSAAAPGAVPSHHPHLLGIIPSPTHFPRASGARHFSQIKFVCDFQLHTSLHFCAGKNQQCKPPKAGDSGNKAQPMALRDN